MVPPSSKKPPASARKRPEVVVVESSSTHTTSTMIDSVTSQVRVGVRVRPITAKEQGAGSTSVLEVVSSNSSSSSSSSSSSPSPCCIALSGRRFTYDAVFDAETSQADLYAQVSPPLLQSFLDGYNATVRVILAIVVHRKIAVL